jgi:hypothetical protein
MLEFADNEVWAISENCQKSQTQFGNKLLFFFIGEHYLFIKI